MSSPGGQRSVGLSDVRLLSRVEVRPPTINVDLRTPLTLAASPPSCLRGKVKVISSRLYSL